MRVAFVVFRFPTLSETFIINQIAGLIERGHEVDIYAERSGEMEKIHENVEKYALLEKTFYLPKHPAEMLSKKTVIKIYWKLLSFAIWLLFRNRKLFLGLISQKPYSFKMLTRRLLYAQLPSLQRKEYDVIHCHFAYMGTAALAIRQVNSPNGKVIATFHGRDVNVTVLDKARKQYRSLFEEGNLFTANTNFTANQAAELGCPRDKIKILPVGLVPYRYPYRENRFPEDGTVRVITVARLVEKKGIEYSIRAVAKSIEEYPSIEYLIVGQGILREPLQALVEELGISDKVKFLGWKTQDEITELYCSSHIFILSSVTASNGDREGQGLVLQEAQAIGLPVLSTIHNGIPDGVCNGQSGFLVPEKDVAALSQKILYLIQNPEKWPDIGRAGRKYVEENYDLEILNQRLEEIYLSSK